MKRKITASLAMLLVLAQLTACSSGSSSTASSAASSSAPASSSAAASSEAASSTENSNLNEIGTLPVVKEKINLTGMIYIRDTDTTKVDDNLWWVKKSEEATNIHIDWTQVNASDWGTQINLMFASGDYPDIIYDADSTGKISSEIYGVDQGILRPIDDLLEYMPNYKTLLDQDEIGKLALTKSDGHMYAVGSYADYNANNGNEFFINQTWLDKLGLATPTTTEELYNVLKAFVTQDPNGNGKNDEIGYEGVFDELTTHFFWMWGIPENNKHLSIDDNQQVYFDPFADGYREAVEYMSKLYTEGLMDPATMTQDSNSKISVYNQNNCGLITAHRLKSMGWDILQQDMTFLLTPHAEGRTALQDCAVGVPDERVFITSTNEYPVETAAWINYQLDIQSVWETYYGPEGTLWNWNADGQCELGPAGDQGVMEYSLGVNGVYYLPSFYYNTVYKQPDYRQERIDYARKYEEAGMVEKYPNELILKIAPSSADDQTEIATLFANLETLYDQSVADMIMHGVTDDKWNTFIDQLKAAGAERYVEIYQTNYDKIK